MDIAQINDRKSMEKCNGRNWYEEKWYFKGLSRSNMNFLNQLKFSFKVFRLSSKLHSSTEGLRSMQIFNVSCFLFSPFLFTSFFICLLFSFLLFYPVLYFSLTFPFHILIWFPIIYILFHLMPSVIRSTFVFETNKFF